MPKPNRLREARFHQRLSQYQLANQTDIPQSRISLIENALVEPREEEKQRLAATLHVPAGYLFPKETINQPQPDRKIVSSPESSDEQCQSTEHP